MDNPENRFAANLSYLLRTHSMTQRALAAKVNRSYQYINEIIKGKAAPSLELMEKIANIFGLEVNDLLSTELPIVEPPDVHDRDLMTRVPFLEYKQQENRLATRASISRAPFGFRTDWLYQMGSPESMVFVRTNGSKLDCRLPDNALVLVDRSQRVIISGAPYLIRMGLELDIKRLTRQGDEVIGHDDVGKEKGCMELGENEDWEIIGRCVWYCKQMT